MEIEIISKESIKPFTSTPQRMKHYKVSLLDQMMSPIPVPLVLYFSAEYPYPDNKNLENFISESTKSLKQSLSKLLIHFYPFAGRINDQLSIDCSDEGFLFAVAKVKSNLSDFLKKPDQNGNHSLLPCQLVWSKSGPGSQVAMVQVNYFNCGGMAIGFVFSHMLADGMTISSFIKSWSLCTYNSTWSKEEAFVMCPPNYIAQSFFPQNKAMENETVISSTMMRYLKFGKSTLRRYVFNSKAISTLRAQSISGDNILRLPSRVEVVSAFLWKCFISANKSNANYSLMNQMVNLRRKADPPFEENCFGNFLWLAPTLTTTTKHENHDLGILVRKFRDTIKKLDGDFVARMHGDEGFSGYCINVEETFAGLPKEPTELLTVTSWCNFGLYNVDFGWGKPIWLNNCGGGGDSNNFPYMNMVWLVDTKKGDGVEAWITLEQHYMSAFDDIEELRQLASMDPSPLEI